MEHTSVHAATCLEREMAERENWLQLLELLQGGFHICCGWKFFLLGSKSKLPPPACQVGLGLLSVVCHARGVQFPGTMYICNWCPLSSAWAHCISCAPIWVLAAIAEDAVAAHSSVTDGPWKLAWTLQEVQARTTDYDLRLSCIYSQSLLLHCFSLSQEPPDTFLKRFSDDNKVIGIEVLPGDPRAKLTWLGFKHNDEKQQAEYWAFVNSDLLFKLFTVPLTNKDMASRIGIHIMHQWHNPLLHTKFSQCLPDDLPRHSEFSQFSGKKNKKKHFQIIICWNIYSSF